MTDKDKDVVLLVNLIALRPPTVLGRIVAEVGAGVPCDVRSSDPFAALTGHAVESP